MPNKAMVQGTTKQPQFKRPKQTAQHLQISVSTLWKWAETRSDVPAFRPLKAGPKVTLFDITAIDAYLRGQN